MTLKELLVGIECATACADTGIEICNVTHCSGEINKGDVYICLKGRRNGNNYIPEAVNRGALAVITESMPEKLEQGCVYVKVPDCRKAYSIIASNYYSNPARNLKLIGIVGTNGKSTTAHLIYELLSASGIKSGLIGTMYYMVGNIRYPSQMTTPDPMQLQRLLGAMVKAGVEVAVMEVSAHAIYYSKVYAVPFECGIFTNLTQDHLDFFETMQKYKSVKQSFFTDYDIRRRIVNIDDECGREIAANSECITYSVTGRADYALSSVNRNCTYTRFELVNRGKSRKMESTLIGGFNLYNILAAVACVNSLGVTSDVIADKLKYIKTADGRFNTKVINGVTYVIDYAHTPDGLINILNESRGMAEGKVIVLFGCGGNRDKLKRPLMGKIASSLADKVILTTDNPRDEDRNSIIKEITQGVEESEKIIIAPDRREAVATACSLACKGDFVVIAGKGAESYIEENGEKIPYSDKKTLCDILGVEW